MNCQGLCCKSNGFHAPFPMPPHSANINTVTRPHKHTVYISHRCLPVCLAVFFRRRDRLESELQKALRSTSPTQLLRTRRFYLHFAVASCFVFVDFGTRKWPLFVIFMSVQIRARCWFSGIGDGLCLSQTWSIAHIDGL